NFFTKNRVAAYAFAVSSEFISNFTSKTRRFDAVKYGEYLEADTILLGRFYQDHLGPLDDFRQGLVPHATVLSARIGYGKHMVRNIQRVIDQTHHIYIRTEEVYKGLDKLSFTYRHELGYILKNKQLIDKTITFAEDGSELLLETWAQGKGLLK
ncbi:MAG: hypothetical protein GY797_13530, partial [Deltaproteobacteria bacterium]|nr:hypothetical protein [Deltaproteobacteria bacterium]